MERILETYMHEWRNVRTEKFKYAMYLNQKCRDFRELNTDTKTQLRFKEDDIEVLVKNKGSNEPYTKIELSVICTVEEIPEFDHRIKWLAKEDKPARRVVDESPNTGHIPSRTSKGHPMSRQNSAEGPTKKRRNNGDNGDEVMSDD